MWLLPWYHTVDVFCLSGSSINLHITLTQKSLDMAASCRLQSFRCALSCFIPFLLVCLFWIQMRRRLAICSSPSDVTSERGGQSGEEARYPGRSSSLLCRPGGKKCSTLLPTFSQRSERYWRSKWKEKIEEGERRRRRCAVLAPFSFPLLSFWQTSYLTQLITHLITVSA